MKLAEAPALPGLSLSAREGPHLTNFPGNLPTPPLRSCLPRGPLTRARVAPTFPFLSSGFKTIIREMIKIGSFIDLSPLTTAPSFQRLTCFLGNTADLSSASRPAYLPATRSFPSRSPGSRGKGEDPPGSPRRWCWLCLSAERRARPGADPCLCPNQQNRPCHCPPGTGLGRT